MLLRVTFVFEVVRPTLEPSVEREILLFEEREYRVEFATSSVPLIEGLYSLVRLFPDGTTRERCP